MTTILKYELEITDSQEIKMPGRAIVLDVAAQYDVLCLWALVDTAQPKVQRRFRVFGTGEPLKGLLRMKFIGLVVMPPFVRHVFEEMKP